ncbi:plasmid partitioning protein RepB [Haematobacter massiliensis]|uniref:plasmid partitioning protein RepB n=1 Tax=Haematobacter massiliensis TaxID=195105 RepID=UPI000B49D42A|nr:plasmid partitioning protein RepB [Haematobacter massiliensis]OWJ71227.1 plasmid partitioning protein RepB [Haematobacter massiliensis]QBJ25768.1 plasmid partitioning protein RepB [Haematobacter massiliensis]
MARKDLLKGLMNVGDPPSPAGVSPGQPIPRPGRGAIGAVSQSIADLRSRSVIDVPPDMIDNAGIRDRLDDDAEGIAALAESIRDYGQQVPVLLRHSPNYEGRYEVVYGRRRVSALKLLGQPVKAMIRNLNDRELVIAQGQENTARKDLSFIEKVNFARAMRDEGFDRKIICDALQIDKTLISRMLSIADAVPLPLMRAIGTAPGIGRDRWSALAARLKGRRIDDVLPLAEGATSDIRFEAVLASLTQRSPSPAPDKIPLNGSSGERLGAVSRNNRATMLTIDSSRHAQFADWLIENMDEIHRSWLSGREE